MSLIIRQKAQPKLDDAGFSMLHAAMKLQHGDPNYLVLRTICGKQVAIVHGVEFSKSNPTVAEVDYSVELLANWLDRNKAKMDEYVLKWAELDNTKSPPIRLDGMTYNSGYGTPYVVVFNEHDVEFHVNEKGLKNLSWRDTLEGDWQKKLKLPAAKLAKAEAYLNEWVEYRALKHRVDELQAELTSCNPH